jgi:hypothetical protein
MRPVLFAVLRSAGWASSSQVLLQYSEVMNARIQAHAAVRQGLCLSISAPLGVVGTLGHLARGGLLVAGHAVERVEREGGADAEAAGRI